MDLFGNKRNYRYKGGNQGKEQRMFWILAILVSAFFLILYYYM